MNGKKAKALRRAAEQAAFTEDKYVQGDSEMKEVVHGGVRQTRRVLLDTLRYPPGSARRIVQDSKKLK